MSTDWKDQPLTMRLVLLVLAASAAMLAFSSWWMREVYNDVLGDIARNDQRIERNAESNAAQDSELAVLRETNVRIADVLERQDASLQRLIWGDVIDTARAAAREEAAEEDR